MKRFWIVWSCTSVGLAAGLVAGFLRTEQYTSTAALVLRAAPIPERLVSPVVSLDLEQTIARQLQTVLSRARLSMVIESLDLYPEMRARLPMEDVLQHFRKQIVIRSEPPNIVRVSYSYADRYKAQRVVSEIASGMIDQSIREASVAIRGTMAFLTMRVDEAADSWSALTRQAQSGKADQRLLLDRDLARKRYEELKGKLEEVKMAAQLAEHKMGPSLEALDPASLPERPDAGRTFVIAIATLIGLMLGLIAQFVYEHRPRRMPQSVPAA